MSTRLLLIRIFFGLAFAFLAAGVVMGFRPVHPGGAPCGSAFTSGEADNPFLADGPVCEQKRGEARGPAVVLLILGGAALAPAVLLALPTNEQASADADARS